MNRASGPHWFFFVIGAVLLGVGVVAVVRPQSQMFLPRGRHVPTRRKSWQFVDLERSSRSIAGLMLVRVVGCWFIFGAVAMVVAGLRHA